MKAFTTNIHILNEEFLNENNKIIYYTHKDEKWEINLELNRSKATNKELDFTIIEIIEEDNILNYLEINEYINSKEYKDSKNFCYQYPKNEKLNDIHLGNKNNYFYIQ